MTRFKPVPPAPADRETLAAARRGVPLVPGDETDCCARIQSRLDLEARDEARTWLTFLRALGLAEETADGGFVRTDRAADDPAVVSDFEGQVYGARELLAALEDADAALTVDDAFERVSVPGWERHKTGTWESEWRERCRHVLDWAVLFGLATRTGDGYVSRRG